MPKKPKPNNWTQVVIANDFHVPYHDRMTLRLFLGFLRDEEPGWLILNGDFMDFWEISSFDLTPKGGKAFQQEIKAGREILNSFREALPSARITWIEGNHEFRLRRYLVKNAKELYGLPGLTVPELFELADLGIEYVPCQKGASKFTDNFVRVGRLYVGHWDRVAKHGGQAAKALVDDKGVSVLQGHTHRFGAHARTTVDGRVLLGIENASMCERKASYASRPNWQLGFSVVYLEPKTKRFQWYPVLITGGRFVGQGRVYRGRLAPVRRIRKAA